MKRIALPIPALLILVLLASACGYERFTATPEPLTPTPVPATATPAAVTRDATP